MTLISIKKEEEENIIKRRLIYDGRGTGEDKRLINILKLVTKFCLTEESQEDMNKNYSLIMKDIETAIKCTEKCDKISQMCDRSFEKLEVVIKEKENDILSAKSELARLELELEYVEKLKSVNEYPDCKTTLKAIEDFEKKKQNLMSKMEKQRNNIKKLLDACQNLQQILDEDDDISEES